MMTSRNLPGPEAVFLSVVIPVFRNQYTVEETCNRIIDVHQQEFPKYSLEIILVDDGSDDQSYEKLMAIYSIYPETVVVIKLSRNFGQLAAIYAGYNASRGAAVITISADLQDPVSLMTEMVRRWEQGDEIVIAYREQRHDDLVSVVFSRLAYGVARKSNPNMPAGGFDYLLLSRRAVELLKSFRGRNRFFQGDVLWLGLRVSFIPYTRQKRPAGKSGWSFSKKLKYFVDLFIDSSYFPIRLMSMLGVTTASVGLLYALVIVYAWLVNETPFQGWAPLMIIVLLIGGMIMTMLGIIGEYLWRIYDDVKSKPLYVVESSIGHNQNFDSSEEELTHFPEGKRSHPSP